jgi:hypothetical protein
MKKNKVRVSFHIEPSDLDQLLASCYRNGRPPKFPEPDTRFYFDADRFRWLCSHPDEAELFLHFVQKNSKPQAIRDWLDGEIRKEEIADAEELNAPT